MVISLSNTRQLLAEVNPDGFKYFLEKLLHEIYEHYDDQELIDVTFKLSNPTALVTAHRLILSAASPYFKKLFKTERGFCHLIEVTEIDSETFERLITFCYTGKALINTDNVDQMLKAAIVLELKDAVANCVDFIIDHITVYTLQRAYALESETQNDLVSRKIFEYETKNFMKLSQSTEFLNFEATKLLKILESDDLNVQCEKDVFKAIKRWYEHDTSARNQQLPALIGCLRLTQFEPNFLLIHIQPLPGCELIALKALSWISHPLARSKLTLNYTKPRGQSEAEEDFLALNIEDAGIIYQYNKNEDLWQKWRDIKKEMNIYSSVIYMNENLIFTGGERNGKAINEVKGWNIKTKTFKRLPSMEQPRYSHSVALLNDKIYVIGGYPGDPEEGESEEVDLEMKSVETYTVSDGWQPANDLITARYAAASVTLNGNIYVMGGWGNDVLKSVERYDPKTGCWTQCADMNAVHENHTATVHNGQIFVLGGSLAKYCRTVECYDPQRNKWTEICSLSTMQYDLGCISIHNQLWAIGGRREDCVFVYDEQNDKWIDKKPMPSKGKYYCFAVPKALLQSDQQM